MNPGGQDLGLPFRAFHCLLQVPEVWEVLINVRWVIRTEAHLAACAEEARHSVAMPRASVLLDVWSPGWWRQRSSLCWFSALDLAWWSETVGVHDGSSMEFKWEVIFWGHLLCVSVILILIYLKCLEVSYWDGYSFICRMSIPRPPVIAWNPIEYSMHTYL